METDEVSLPQIIDAGLPGQSLAFAITGADSCNIVYELKPVTLYYVFRIFQVSHLKEISGYAEVLQVPEVVHHLILICPDIIDVMSIFTHFICFLF